MVFRLFVALFLAFSPSLALAYDYEVTGRVRDGEELLKVRGMQWNWGPDEIPETGRLIAKTEDALLKGSETRVFSAEVGGRAATIAYQFYEGELFAIQVALRVDLDSPNPEIRFLDFIEFNEILTSKYGESKDIGIWYDVKAKNNKRAWKKAYEERQVSFDNYWFVEGIEISHKLPREADSHSIWYTHFKRHSNVLGVIAQGRRDEL